jgi:uncharacterized protein (TIGR02186 family)
MAKLAHIRISLLAVLVATAAPSPGRAQDLVADLSDHLIAVTTGFSGTRILLFGTQGEEAGDIVVVVRGPDIPVVVRRKDRYGGVWVNRDLVRFERVPSFYHVASNRPLGEIANARVLGHLQIGLESLRLGGEGMAQEELRNFRRALIRIQNEQGLYRSKEGEVNYLGGRLFRTQVEFPSNVPTGHFLVTTYKFKDGQVVNAQTTPLQVSKIGIGARIFDFAHQHSALYGITAIIIALFSGWLAGVMFRRA